MELFRNSGFSRVRVPRRGAFHSGLARALSSAVSAASAFLSAWPALCQARSAPRAPSSRLGPRSVKRGQRRERLLPGLARALSSAVSAASAFFPAWPALCQARSAPRAEFPQQLCLLTGTSAVSAASACERTALRFAKQQGAIAMQSNGVERSRSGD